MRNGIKNDLMQCLVGAKHRLMMAAKNCGTQDFGLLVNCDASSE